MSTRPRLSEWEQNWAFVTGGGMALIILAFGLSAMRGTSDNNGALDFVLIIGIVLAVVGIAGWLIQFRPWLTFDDQATPLYTGHDAHGHDAVQDDLPGDPHTAHALTGVIVEPPLETHPAQPSLPPPPVLMDPMIAFPPAAPAAVMPPVMLDPMIAFPPAAPTPSTAPETTPVVPDAIPPKTANGHDNFETLVGVGPKIAAALTASGIFTFAELIRRTPEELERIVRDSGVRMVGNANTWVEQARFAAAGDTEALKQYQDALQHPGESHE